MILHRRPCRHCGHPTRTNNIAKHEAACAGWSPAKRRHFAKTKGHREGHGRFTRKGETMPKQEVHCTVPGCTATLMRAGHFGSAKCPYHMRLHKNRNWRALNKTHQVQARRYRVLLHLLGYEDEQWEDLLEELKSSPMAFRAGPETPQAARDWRAA
jgi:hypothetical protein